MVRKSQNRHPEVAAHHTNALSTCTAMRGPRRMTGHDPGRRHPEVPLRPNWAGGAPQGDGGVESVARCRHTLPERVVQGAVWRWWVGAGLKPAPTKRGHGNPREPGARVARYRRRGDAIVGDRDGE